MSQLVHKELLFLQNLLLTLIDEENQDSHLRAHFISELLQIENSDSEWCEKYLQKKIEGE